MAISDILQIIAEARVDAKSLSEFMYKPADFMVNRRLSPPINTLDFYIDRISSVNASLVAVQQSVAAADALIDNNAAQAADAVSDAIEGVAVDANLITDALIATTGKTTQARINNGFAATANVTALSQPIEGMRVHVNSLNVDFIYSTTNNKPANGGTVLQGIGGKWEMTIQPVYYASWFATPDVQESQTLQLQAGYDYATSMGRPFVIDGEYWIDVTAQQVTGVDEGSVYDAGIVVRSKSVLSFKEGAKLSVLTNNAPRTMALLINNDVSDFIIQRPRITGDRKTHIYGSSTHESTFLIGVFESSNGLIDFPHVDYSVGDGIYIGKVWHTQNSRTPKNIVIHKPIVRSCGRNGISMCAWDNVEIHSPDIEYIGNYEGLVSYEPLCGIDIEPEHSASTPGTKCEGGLITNLRAVNCGRPVNIFTPKSDLKIELHFAGLTYTDKSVKNGANFVHKGLNCTGLIKFDHLHMESSGSIWWFWSAVGSLKLQIDRYSYAYTDKAGVFEIDGTQNISGTSKLIGNTYIAIDAPTRLIYGIRNGTDVGAYSYKNLTLKPYEGTTTYIEQGDNSVNTLSKFPKVSSSTILNGTTKLDSAATADAVARVMNTVALKPVTGSPDMTVNLADYPYNNDITITQQDKNSDAKITVSGVSLKINGAAKSSVSVTGTRGAWITLRKDNQFATIVKNRSAGWDI